MSKKSENTSKRTDFSKIKAEMRDFKLDFHKVNLKFDKPNVKHNLIAGLIAITPIFITIYVLVFLLNLVGGSLGELLSYFPGMSHLPRSILTVLAVLLVVLLTYFTGLLTRSFVGSKILSYSENFLTRVPLVRGIYKASRQLTTALFSEKVAFRRAVLVQFPRKGFYSMGFITSDVSIDIKGKQYINVFIPTTPNPTTGFYLMVPKEEIVYLAIPPDEAIKIIMSGGIILKQGGLRIENAVTSQKPQKTDKETAGES